MMLLNILLVLVIVKILQRGRIMGNYFLKKRYFLGSRICEGQITMTN